MKLTNLEITRSARPHGLALLAESQADLVTLLKAEPWKSVKRIPQVLVPFCYAVMSNIFIQICPEHNSLRIIVLDEIKETQQCNLAVQFLKSIYRLPPWRVWRRRSSKRWGAEVEELAQVWRLLQLWEAREKVGGRWNLSEVSMHDHFLVKSSLRLLIYKTEFDRLAGQEYYWSRGNP